MGLTIPPPAITSDYTRHIARPAPDADHLREVPRPLGRRLSRDSAITAMVIADPPSPGDLDGGHWLWPHVEDLAAELALTAPEALTQIADPPRWANTYKSGAPDRPEAAG